jgi:hypothetical protein
LRFGTTANGMALLIQALFDWTWQLLWPEREGTFGPGVLLILRPLTCPCRILPPITHVYETEFSQPGSDVELFFFVCERDVELFFFCKEMIRYRVFGNLIQDMGAYAPTTGKTFLKC